jgi:hypothetical protein
VDVEVVLRPVVVVSVVVDVLDASEPRRRRSRSLTPRWPTTSQPPQTETLMPWYLQARRVPRHLLLLTLPWMMRCFERAIQFDFSICFSIPFTIPVHGYLQLFAFLSLERVHSQTI